MVISDNCLIGESVSEKAKSIIEALKKNECTLAPWFAVTDAPDTDEILFILSCHELGKKIYDKEHMKLLSIAGSKEEALSMVTTMIQQACDQNKILDLKQFFIDY